MDHGLIATHVIANGGLYPFFDSSGIRLVQFRGPVGRAVDPGLDLGVDQWQVLFQQGVELVGKVGVERLL